MRSRHGYRHAELSAGGKAMPHYYFHLRTTDGIVRDEKGITFPSIDQAKADALSSLFEMAADELSGEHESKMIGIDITDGQRTVLASVKMGDDNKGQHLEEAKDSNEGHAFIHGRGRAEKP